MQSVMGNQNTKTTNKHDRTTRYLCCICIRRCYSVCRYSVHACVSYNKTYALCRCVSLCHPHPAVFLGDAWSPGFNPFSSWALPSIYCTIDWVPRPYLADNRRMIHARHTLGFSAADKKRSQQKKCLCPASNPELFRQLGRWRAGVTRSSTAATIVQPTGRRWA